MGHILFPPARDRFVMNILRWGVEVGVLASLVLVLHRSLRWRDSAHVLAEPVEVSLSVFGSVWCVTGRIGRFFGSGDDKSRQRTQCMPNADWISQAALQHPDRKRLREAF